MKRFLLLALSLILAVGLIFTTGSPVLAEDPPPTGTVWAWGYNYAGQLGNNSTTNSKIPVPVTGLSGVIAIAGGANHSLAVKSDGTVWAWGYNADGQLGNNTTTDSKIPVPVAGLSGVIAIAGGGAHSLALKSDGTVWAWGANAYGQLGNNTTTDSKIPVPVAGLSGVIAIAGGGAHSLALKSDGRVWAWGYNGWGQLGNNTLINSKIPVPVAGLSGVIAIAGGHGHSLALQGAAPPPVTESKFIYSIKFLCGRGSESFGVKPANYATAINIHNFHDETVTLKKKVVIAHREGEPPGEVTPYTDNVSLGSNIAIEVDCVDICELLGEEDPATGRCMRFLKGFVVIESSQPLNIVAVYTSSTGGWFGGGFSMDIEYISPVVSP